MLDAVSEKHLGTGERRWGYVDLRGRYAVAPTLPTGDRLRVPGPFRAGVACVSLGRGVEGYIDRTGKVLARAAPPLCDLPEL